MLAGEHSCLCGRESAQVACKDLPFQCGQVCGRQLDCGHHSCQAICHTGKCGSCPLQGPRSCPCGKVSSSCWPVCCPQSSSAWLDLLIFVVESFFVTRRTFLMAHEAFSTGASTKRKLLPSSPSGRFQSTSMFLDSCKSCLLYEDRYISPYLLRESHVHVWR